jgi:putative Mg2+ transporter-C (MgtC) family protein
MSAHASSLIYEESEFQLNLWRPLAMLMPLYLTWDDIALRLLLTLIAGVVVGLDRGARGHAAGLRTTILVALAAAIAMLQANLLLSVGGKQHDSFGVMDLMRMPLGILTGIGFIGGGAIVKRGELVTGVTTAATIWIMTTIGLCFGGGQLGLGVAGTILTILTLRAVNWVDVRMPREQHAVLAIAAPPNSSSLEGLSDLLAPLGFKVRFRRQTGAEDSKGSRQAKLWFEISWKQADAAEPPHHLLNILNGHYPVVSLELTTEARHHA